RRVWPVLVEPVNVALDLLAEGSLAQGDKDSPQTLRLQGEDEPFDYGDCLHRQLHRVRTIRYGLSVSHIHSIRFPASSSRW
ncbi:MAG: hypothetical protein ACYSUI_16085, partial [Planctomycetota bacterium]